MDGRREDARLVGNEREERSAAQAHGAASLRKTAEQFEIELPPGLTRLGDTADLTRAEGEDVDVLGVVVGIRLWF